VAWRCVFALEGIPNDLPELAPYITGPERMIVVFTLIVVPSALQALFTYKADDINTHVASARKPLYLGVDSLQAVVPPLLDKVFPLVG
jgi:hypothetical protein